MLNSFYRYLPVNDDTRKNDVYVTAGGFTLIPPHSTYPPLPHPDDHQFQWTMGRILQEYQIIFVARGEGTFESRCGGRRQVTSGTLFMLFPGEWHRYSPNTDTGWDEYWVAYRGEKAAALATDFSLSPSSPFIHGRVNVPLKDEFIRITDELRSEEVGYQRIIACRIPVILAMAWGSSKREGFEDRGILPVIEEAKRQLTETLDRNVNVEELAAKLNVGYSLFRKEFRRYTGFSPAQYHLERRINYAKKLLSGTTIPVALIGERIGMESPGYFSRLFKEKTGFAPRDFRSLSQKNENLLNR